MPRLSSIASVVCGLAMLVLASTASLAQKTCTGTDMLAEIRTSEPDVYARLSSQAAAVANTEAMLWRVEKTGAAPSHLLGTVHLSDPRVAKLTPAIQSALEKSSTMALEIADLSPEKMASSMALAVPLFVYMDGRQLDTVLSADQFAKARDSLAKNGLPAEMASKIKPWFVFMLLAVAECERNRQAAGALALDSLLEKEAERRKMPVVGLETFESQLGVFAALPESQQVDMLKATLFHVDRAGDQLETLVELYLNRKLGYAIPFQYELAPEGGGRTVRIQGLRERPDREAQYGYDSCITAPSRQGQRVHRRRRAPPRRCHRPRRAAAQCGLHGDSGRVTFQLRYQDFGPRRIGSMPRPAVLS